MSEINLLRKRAEQGDADTAYALKTKAIKKPRKSYTDIILTIVAIFIVAALSVWGANLPDDITTVLLQGCAVGIMLLMFIWFLFNAFAIPQILHDNHDLYFHNCIENNTNLAGAQVFIFNDLTGIAIAENGFIGLLDSETNLKTIHINEINKFSINIDGTSSANLGNAALGGLLFGGFGALIGSQMNVNQDIQNIEMVFNINDFKNPSITLPVVSTKITKGTDIHKQLKEKLNKVASLLEIVEKNSK